MSRALSCPNKLTVITAVSHVIDKTKKNINQEKRAGAITGIGTGGSTMAGTGWVFWISAGLIDCLHATHTRHDGASICPQAGQRNGSSGNAESVIEGAESSIEIQGLPMIRAVDHKICGKHGDSNLH